MHAARRYMARLSLSGKESPRGLTYLGEAVPANLDSLIRRALVIGVHAGHCRRCGR
jgi:hypothetical protein